MKSHATPQSNKRLKYIVLSVVALLFAVFVVSSLTDEVNWQLPDYIIAGLLLFSIGAAYDAVTKRITSVRERLVVVGALTATLLLSWVQLAVGVL